ncbi:hypothetical protein PM004_03265 [Clostridium paraputrificum]|uniref:hypothetical protein n=1 Tax=Clostridium paraputrificum TaxID=29363 RepID=UPI00232B1962|nr:hypothetical protein [Clostridium paraputrificum]MDB2088338.1 hypothetical protein [Clostridium paraputrificum]MDB2095088.1 hypothetical protein [Clostridium paraputrificum]
MAEAFVLEGKVLLDAKNVMSDLDKIDKKASETGSTFDKIKSKAGDFSKKLDKWVTRGLAAGGAALGAFGIKAINTASDLQEVQNVVDTTFESNAEIINQWAKEAPEAIGMSELAYKQYAGTMGAMLKSMGMTSEQTKNMSGNIVDLAGDMASFYNLDHEVAFEKIRSGISGETEPLKALGINMSVANLEAYRLAQGLKKPYNQMSQSEQVMLRYNYLFEQTADAQGDFSKTSNGFANQLRILSLRFQTLAADIGEKLLPYALKFVGWANENIDKLPMLVGILGGLLVTVKGFFVITKIKQALDAWNIATATSTTVTKGATLAQKGLNLAWLSSPITWIVGGIMLLIGAIVLLWNKSDAFRQDVVNMWNTITSAFQSFDDFLSNIFSVDWSTTFGSFGNVINAFLVNVKGVWDSIKQVFGGIIDFIGGVFSGDWDRAWQGVKNIFGGIMNGLGAVIKAPLNAVIGLINGAIQGINDAISFTVPDWIPGLGGKGFSVNIPKINYLENGGIFTRPTMISPNIMTGEKNKGTQPQTEVMIPLDRLEQWIKWLASRPVAIDGRELMRVVAPYQNEFEEYNNRFAY